MENLRFKALESTLNRIPNRIEPPKEKVSEYFGSLTFSRKAMREFLPVDAYDTIISAIDSNVKINRGMADQIAASMKAWALPH